MPTIKDFQAPAPPEKSSIFSNKNSCHYLHFYDAICPWIRLRFRTGSFHPAESGSATIFKEHTVANHALVEVLPEKI